MIRHRRSKDDEVFADALEGGRPRNSDIQQLVHFAESLCEAAVEPSAVFVLNLRAELMADAATVLAVTDKPVRADSSRHLAHQVAHPVRRRLAAATAGVLATAGTVGIVASSAQAVPGDMLYQVKRGVESIELTMHRSDSSRGSFQLSQATERLAEAQTLAAKGNAREDGLVVASLSDFADTASSGSEALFSDYASGGDNASIDRVISFATASSTMLSGLSGNLSPDASAAFKVAASTVTDLASQASTLCNACRTAELTSLAQTVASLVKDADSANSGTNQSVTEDGQQAPKSSELFKTDTNTVSPPKLPPVPAPTDSTKPLVQASPGVEDPDGLLPGLLGGSLVK